VSRPNLDTVVVQVRSLPSPSLDSADRFELLEIHGRAWHADIVSELSCVHLSIFEYAEIACRTEQSVRCVGAEASFGWLRLIVRVSSIPGLCSSLSRRRSGFEPVFRASIWLRNGRQRERPQRLFFPSG